jgi:hypothetical protein
MDPQRVAYFIENYARMSDDELSFLIATRKDQLTAEAVQALQLVIERRGPERCARELQASAVDVEAQRQQEQATIERRAATARWQLRLIRQFSAALIVVGLAIALILQQEGGWWVALSGATLLVYAEVRRLLRMFIARLFRPD